MKKVLAISFSVILPFASMAEEGKSAINYNYVEAGYGSMSIDGDPEKYSGNYIGGSFAINDNFNFLMSSTSGDENILGVNVGVKLKRFGIGYHTPLDESTDLQVSYEDAEVTATGTLGSDSASITVDGSVLSIGAATMLSNDTQVSASFDRWKSDGVSENGNTIAIVHQVTDTFALTAKRFNVDGGDITTYGVRYNF